MSSMNEMEMERRKEQERRRRNAQRFVQLNNTNPWQPKHLFSQPVQRNDEAREDLAREKIMDIWNSFKRPSSPTPSPTSAKRLKLEIPKNDPVIDDIMGEVKVPDLILLLQMPKKNANVEIEDIELEKLFNPPVILSPIINRKLVDEKDPELEKLFNPPVILSPIINRKLVDEKDHETMENFKEVFTHNKSSKVSSGKEEQMPPLRQPLPKMILRKDTAKSTKEQTFYSAILVDVVQDNK